MTTSVLQLIAPPTLPFAPGEYQTFYQDQLNSILRMYFNRLSSNLNSVTGELGGSFLQSPNAMFMSDQDQTSAGITVANTLTYNQPAIEEGIEVRNGGEIWFEKAGHYLVTFTLQVANRGNAAETFEVWATSNGTNYPLSNTRFDIPARKSLSVWSHITPAITGIFAVTDPENDYLTIKWWASSTDVFIEHYPDGVSPTRPAIPSVIMTVNFVSRLP